MRTFCQHSYHGVRVSRTAQTGKSEQGEWKENASGGTFIEAAIRTLVNESVGSLFGHELNFESIKLIYWWRRNLGLSGNVLYLRLRLKKFLDPEQTNIDLCFKPHMRTETNIRDLIWNQFMPSPRKVILKWEWLSSDHGFHELVPLLLSPLRLHHHRHRRGLPLRRRLRHRALDDHRDRREPLGAGLHPDHRLPPDVPPLPGHDPVTQVRKLETAGCDRGYKYPTNDKTSDL